MREKKAYVSFIRARMREGEINWTVRRDLYYRYLIFNEVMSGVEGGADLLEVVRADSLLTGDLYLGLSLILDWADGTYILNTSLDKEIWEGIEYIATGDPSYLYRVEESRRSMADSYATRALAEDLESMGI